MNITELLKKDHREVNDMICELESADVASAATFGKLKNALTLHSKIEEEIFYEVLKNFNETAELISEGYRKHGEVAQLLQEMTALKTTDEEFYDLLAQLRATIDDNVEDEENELFPQAEKLLGTETLEKMGNSLKDEG